MAPAQLQSRFLRVMDPYNASVLAWNTIKSLGMDQVLQEHRADRQSTTLFFERPDRLLQLCLVSPGLCEKDFTSRLKEKAGLWILR
jgi:hypothetical protein